MGSLRENISQEKAINTTEGPVIIVSCPGSGKTTTLTRRIRRIIEKGTPPFRILMVTFTNAATKDMSAKYRMLYGEDPGGVKYSTLHSLCLEIIRESGRYENIRVFDSDSQMDTIISAIGYNSIYVDNRFKFAGDVVMEIGRMKNMGQDIAQYIPQCCEKKTFETMYKAYEQAKTTTGCLDYEDMLIVARDLLREDDDLRERMQDRFDYIQCDEYQDTNTIQRDVLYMLSDKHHNLCVVGDDDQSIYRFRGTDSSIMMNFEKDFLEKGIRCEVIKMGTNYRCAQKIVDISSACIHWNKDRIGKEFISERGRSGEKGEFTYRKLSSANEEARVIVDIIKKRHEEGTDYRSIAVLYRKNSQVTYIAQALSAAEIPYFTRDRLTCVYDEWMFRDIRAYAELSVGIDERANLLRILNKPSRYLSSNVYADLPYTTEGMLAGIGRSEKEWQHKDKENKVYELLNNFGHGKVSLDDPPEKLKKRLYGKGSVHYERYLKSRAEFNNEEYADVKAKFEDLFAEGERFATIKDWFNHAEDVRRMVRRDSQKRDPRGVMLSTIHSAKGLEWDTVIVAGVSQNTIPGKGTDDPKDIEEERRILYVGMTRAARYLAVTGYGKESEFMQQAMEELKRRKMPSVPKKLRGAPVMNQKYGKGKIEKYTKDRVFVDFGGEYGVKKFVFPDAFIKKYLQYI